AGAIRAGDWKLIEFFADGNLELYNLKSDLSESTNLALKNPEKAAELQQKLADWRTSVGAAMPVKNPKYDPSRASQFWNRRTNQPVPERKKTRLDQTN
ncbi:MAG: arylsulfatase, partial [Planctomycetaceae bacterium]|nr:arylsulfatase [Planctomycetaceae bacterium]